MIQSRRDLMAAASLGFVGLATSTKAQNLSATPTQRTGPFYPVVAARESRVDLTHRLGAPEAAHGSVVEVSGRVLDLGSRPIGSAIVLIWQADGTGHYDHPGDVGRQSRDPGLAAHAVLRTASDGGFHLTTVRPGAYADDRSRSGLRTPHIHYEIFGEEGRLITEMYFPDEPLNEADANIAEMIAAGADPQLLTARIEGAPQRTGATSLRWDVVLGRR